MSVGTVDRVVNARGNVSPKTEQLVLRLAREMRLDRSLDLRPTRQLRLGVVLQNRTNPFYRSLVEAFAEVGNLYRHLALEVRHYYYERLSRTDIAAKVRAAATTCDGVVVDIFDEPSLREMLNELSKTKPVLTLASDLPQSGRVSYIGVDARAEGRVAGELMGKFLGPAGGEVLLISGSHSFHAHEQREMGFRAVLRERFPGCSVTIALESKEGDGAAQRRIHSLLRSSKSIAGIYNISVGSPSIANVLRQLDRADKVTFITHELTDENRALLCEGVLDAVIDQDCASEARLAVQTFLASYGRFDAPLSKPSFRIFIAESLSP